MITTFTELPDSARIWIYQSNRNFTEEELKEINDLLTQFLTEWTAHGAALRSGL